MEQFYQLAVNEILPGFFVNKGTHVGGPSCTIAIDGAGFAGKTKSAFPDNTLLIPGNKRAIREAILLSMMRMIITHMTSHASWQELAD
jgi:hypothetical protein